MNRDLFPFRCHRSGEISLQLQIATSGTLEGRGGTYKSFDKRDFIKGKVFSQLR